MASIQSVAERAKVGVGTVSRVINGSGYVSEKTRKKVLKAIKELDYVPNELARNLLHQRTNIIAMVIPDISNPFYAWLVDEVEKELRKRGFKMMLCNTVGEKTNERAYLDMLNRSIVDGILSGTHTLDFDQYRQIKRPMVFFDAPPSVGVPVIMADHQKGGNLAAEALIRSGCKEVVQFADKVAGGDEFPFFKRHEAFRKRMKEAGVVCHDYITEWDEFDNAYFQNIVEDCYDRYPGADGVLGVDTLAAYYMKHALTKGKRVPDELKIVAYDGTSLLKTTYPTISAIVQPVKELARNGVEQLLKQIEGGQSEDCIALDVTFEKGMSTK